MPKSDSNSAYELARALCVIMDEAHRQSLFGHLDELDQDRRNEVADFFQELAWWVCPDGEVPDPIEARDALLRVADAARSSSIAKRVRMGQSLM